MPGDIATIRKKLSNTDVASVDLAWANDEFSLCGLSFEIEALRNTEDFYDRETYVATVVSPGRWKSYCWYVPVEWFETVCMFDV